VGGCCRACDDTFSALRGISGAPPVGAQVFFCAAAPMAGVGVLMAGEVAHP
jgi:hypothetical protein